MYVCNDVDMYGNVVNYNDIIENSFSVAMERSKFFKMGTVVNSCIENELRLLPFRIGIGDNSYNAFYYALQNDKGQHIRLCNYEKVKKIEYKGWLEIPKEVTYYKILDSVYVSNFEKEYKEVFEQYLKDHSLYETYDKKFNELLELRSKDFYYEFSTDGKHKDLELYVERSDEWYQVHLSKTCHFEINLNGYLFKGSDIGEELIKFLFKNRELFKDFKKLENGVVWNNKFYEREEDVICDIAYTINGKNKHDLILNGLDLDKFNKLRSEEND